MAKTVLLVDDDAMIRTCVSDVLSDHGGFVVHMAGDGAAALGLVEQGLAFDVLLTDRRMPNMGGEELVAALRRRGCRQYVIMMTGDVRVPAAIPGVDRIVPKPFRVFELLELIAAAVPHPA